MLKNLEIINELHEHLIERGFSHNVYKDFIQYDYKSNVIILTFTEIWMGNGKNGCKFDDINWIYIYDYDKFSIMQILNKADEWMGK